jgi:hypothetical protein
MVDMSAPYCRWFAMTAFGTLNNDPADGPAPTPWLNVVVVVMVTRATAGPMDGERVSS